MTPTITGKVASSPNLKPQVIAIRQAHLRDAGDIGRLTAKAYHDTPLTSFLAPYREKYPAQYIRSFQERTLTRMLDPRYLSFVATVPGEDGYGEVVIGEAQFRREGWDYGAKTQIRQRWSLWLVLAAWLFWGLTKALSFLVEDRISNKARLEVFARSQIRQANYWAERPNRWYAQSVVVDERFRGRGIGKRLMGEILWRAKAEGVVVALESSSEGEIMYRSLGFKLLERFDPVDGLDDGVPSQGGGFMIWEQGSKESGNK